MLSQDKRRTQITVVDFVSDQRLLLDNVLLSVNSWRGTSQIISPCLTMLCMFNCAQACGRPDAPLSPVLPPLLLLTVHSRHGSDLPCVVFSDGARTWSLSRGNGLFSLPRLHKEPYCSSPHIPRWLPTPGFGLPGQWGLRLHELFFFVCDGQLGLQCTLLTLHLVPNNNNNNNNTLHSKILVHRC